MQMYNPPLPRHAIRVKLTDRRGLDYVFPSVAAASAFIGCTPSGVSNAIAGRCPTIGGYKAQEMAKLEA